MRLINPYPQYRRVIVNTKTDRAFRGFLAEKRRRHLVLKNAEMLREQGQAVPIDGEVVVMAENVDFIQVIA